MLFAVTGGGGYTGYHIGYKLCEGGHNVRLLDIRPPDKLWDVTAPLALYDALPKEFWETFGDPVGKKGKMEFLWTDILDIAALRRSFSGVDGIIHTASFGVSGEEQMPPYFHKQEMINLMGTKNALEAAHKEQVKAFVFTSTYNVIYGGEDIFEGDESLPYFPLYKHVDQYSRTKAMAEMLVLSFDGKQWDFSCNYQSDTNSDGKLQIPAVLHTCQRSAVLHTCSLRLNGIMGLGEQRHMNRILKVLRQGLFLFTYGNKTARVDFVGIQNVVQAHIRALMQLLTEFDIKSSKEAEKNVSGEAFFISDESPINNFEYLRPLVEGLGYRFPTLNLPFQLIFILAKIQEFLYTLIYKVFPFVPFLTPVEAFKTGRTHYFKCGKAKERFGYIPTRPNDLSQVTASFKERKSNTINRFPTILCFCCFAIAIFYILLYIIN